jgi:hypothetical protein
MENIASKAMRARGFAGFMCVSFAGRSGLFQAPVMKVFIRTGARIMHKGWCSKRLRLLLLWIVVEEEGGRTNLKEQIRARHYSFHCCHCRLPLEAVIQHRVRQRKKDNQD